MQRSQFPHHFGTDLAILDDPADKLRAMKEWFRKGVNTREHTIKHRKKVLTTGHADANMRCGPTYVDCAPPSRILSTDPRVIQGREERATSARDFGGRPDIAGDHSGSGVWG